MGENGSLWGAGCCKCLRAASGGSEGAGQRIRDGQAAQWQSRCGDLCQLVPHLVCRWVEWVPGLDASGPLIYVSAAFDCPSCCRQLCLSRVVHSLIHFVFFLQVLASLSYLRHVLQAGPSFPRDLN